MADVGSGITVDRMTTISSPPAHLSTCPDSIAPFVSSACYPDAAIQIIDPAFASYRLFSSAVERIVSGLRWAEGPVWFGDGRYLLVSDIPNNRIVRWDEASGQCAVFRSPSNHANGLARDHQGRLLACEHLTRCVTRTEYNGRITVLADRFEGLRLNSPNDLACDASGSIWFTDPPFGIGGDYEGEEAVSERVEAVYRIDGSSGQLAMVCDDLLGPNGLCFSPDGHVLYIVESRAKPSRLIWAYDVASNGRLSNKRLHIDANGPGAFDGIACDRDGNLWCGFGSNGASGVDPQALDGVMVYDRGGKSIGRIVLPERCANLCFGGARGNRLFMASSQSVYSLFVNTRGAGY